MSSTVDKRIVDMGFNNQQFEKGVKQSTKSLDGLKKSLDLTESAKGLNALNAAGKNVKLDNIAKGVKSVSMRFKALGIIGMAALENFTNAAIEYGKKFVQGMIAPLKEGFAEYETQMNAIQTVLANTEKAGTTLSDVSAALDELNTYADKTIYNFTEMTKNIGTFTAAGVDLETSVSAIKGIANLAAVSGSNSQQAATAMYQLSQALSSGTVKLMDWNSVVNAGMGGQVFQDALVETAEMHGVAVNQMIEQEGSFRNTLQSGWLTSEVLLDTLSKFTGDLSEQQLEALGYTEEQIIAIMRLGEMANDAATKVKTFTQLKDTLNEAMASGWTQSWQLIIGDFEEAKALFTEISDVMGAIIQNASDSRNAILKSWKLAGGRAALIDSLWNSFNALLSIMAPIKDAFAAIFPSKGETLTGIQLARLTERLRDFTASLILSEETAKKVKRIFSGVFAIFAIGRDVIVSLLTPLLDLTKGISLDGGGLLDFLANLGDQIVEFSKTGNIAESISNALALAAEKVREFGEKIYYALEQVKEKFEEIKAWFTDLFSGIDFNFSPITSFVGKVKTEFNPLEGVSESIAGLMERIKETAKEAMPEIGKVLKTIADFLAKWGDRVLDALGTIKLSDIIDVLSGLMGVGLLLAIQRFVAKGSGLLDEASGMFEGVTDILDGVRGSLQAYQQQLKSKVLLNIAISVAILAAALIALSMIDSTKLAIALAIITGLFVDLTASMAAFGRMGGSTQSLGLMGLATALLVLSFALSRLALIDPGGMTRGLAAITALLTMLIIFSKMINADALGGFKKSAISLNAFALSLLVMSYSVKKLGAMDPAELTRGLLAIGALLAEIAIFMRIVGEGSASTKAGIAMIAMAGAIMLISLAVARFGGMDPEILHQGLLTMGIIFAEIAAFTRLSGDGKSTILTAIAMTIMAGALYIMIDVLQKLGKMSWEEIGKGLAGMGGALLILAIAMRALPSNMLIQSIALIAVAGALTILADVLIKLGDMDWEELGKGLLALGGSLLIITLALYAMSGTLAGSAALVVAAGALFILVNVLKTLGNMSLYEIGLALGALAAIFIVLGLAGLALTPVVPSLLGLGVSMLLIGAGLALIGAGIFLFATGLGLLAATGAAAAIVIVAMITTILGVVPLIITAIINALIIFAEGIIKATPVVEEAITGLLLAFLQIIIDITPKLYEALDVLLDKLIQLIEDHIPAFIVVIILLITTLLEEIAEQLPDFIQAGWDILIGFLSGIRDNIGELVIVVAEIITEFLDAVALAVPDIIQSGWDLMLAFINGLTASVDDNLEEILTAIGNLAASIIDGLVRGIAEGAGLVIAAVVKLAKDAFDAAMKFLRGESPSKLFTELGYTIPQGLAKGIKVLGHLVPTEVKKVAKATVSAMSKAVTAITEGIEGEMDLDPTIRPIVDMTDIEKVANLLDDMLGDRSVGLASTVARTSSDSGVIAVDKDGNPVTATSIELNQYNYSPKALSRIEIYRQTQNQLRGAKGLLDS
jgi:tape measure domain-containing protein